MGIIDFPAHAFVRDHDDYRHDAARRLSVIVVWLALTDFDRRPARKGTDGFFIPFLS